LKTQWVLTMAQFWCFRWAYIVSTIQKILSLGVRK